MGMLAVVCLLGAAFVLAPLAEGDGTWTEPYVYDIGKEVQASECTSRGCDITDALNRAMSACESELSSLPGTSRQYTGCRFDIPAGDHTLRETIAVCRAHTFVGKGGAQRRALTVINATKTAFHGKGYGECGLGTSAGAITVRDLGIAFPNVQHSPPIVAIKAEATVYLENLWIIYPDVGVWITADVTRTPPSNANGSRLFNVKTEYTRHAGMIFNGGDSNAHANIAPNASSACQAPSAEMAGLEFEFGPCGSIVDRSFLGNFHVAGHVAAAAAYPDLRAIGANNHAAFLGVYVEGNTAPDLSSQWSVWIGGHGAVPLGPGFRLDGHTATTLKVRNDTDPLNPVTFEAGRATQSGGTFYGLRHEQTNWPLRMKWNNTLNGGSFLEDIANAGTARVRSIRGTRNDPAPVTPPADGDRLGQTKHWDVEDMLP